VLTPLGLCLTVAVTQLALASPRLGTANPGALGPPDSALGAGLAAIAEDLGIAPLARNGRASLALVDLTQAPAHAGIAADSTLGAASVAKLAVLLGAFAAAEAGRIELTPDLRQILERMIRGSSNPDATRAIKRLGFPFIASVLEDPRYALHDRRRGGLWVGRDYSGGKIWRREARSREPHAASAAAVARFYVLLHRNELVSPAASAAMREMLAVTTYDHKFVAGLREACHSPAPKPGQTITIPGYRILRKSGSWGPWQADSALIEAEGRRYVLVCLLEDRDKGESRLRRLAVAVDRMIAGMHSDERKEGAE
jgi:beta-lactamase class A